MPAICFNIVSKRRASPLAFANVNDFKLQQSGNVSPQIILENPDITLYSLDFQANQGIFVETPPAINLSEAPFLYDAQYEHATRVFAVPFGLMVQLAKSIQLNPAQLIFLHSVGRAGSTLAGQICSKVKGVINISEPEALTWLVPAKLANPGIEAELIMFFDACIRFLCKTPVQTAWVIKGRSFVIELGDWIYKKYPGSKNIFLYRDAETWLKSSLQAYTFELPEAEMREQEKNLKRNLSPLVPRIAKYNKSHHLTTAEIISLMWLSVMDRYMRLHDMGFEMMAIRFENWNVAPRETAIAMLEYCGLNIDDAALDNALSRDSQAGTHLSRETLSKKGYNLREEDIRQLKQLLHDHPVIQTPDYMVPNTMPLANKYK